MSFTYAERKELNTLSKETFGVASFWYNQLVKKGVKDQTTGKRVYLTTYEEVKARIDQIKENTANMLSNMKASVDGDSK